MGATVTPGAPYAIPGYITGGCPAGYAYPGNPPLYAPPSGYPGHWPNQGSSKIGSAHAKGLPRACARDVSAMRIQQKMATVKIEKGVKIDYVREELG